MTKGADDYEVGYGKPPKRTQFAPGVSGNKGRRKRPETQAEIIARIRDELVEVNGKLVTKFEVAIHRAFNQALLSGKIRDLQILLELLDKYGALPKADQWAESKANADNVIEKIRNVFLKTNDIDPADFEERRLQEREDALLVTSCPHCGPALKFRWRSTAYRDLAKRIGKTGLHKEVERLHSKRD